MHNVLVVYNNGYYNKGMFHWSDNTTVVLLQSIFIHVYSLVHAVSCQ